MNATRTLVLISALVALPAPAHADPMVECESREDNRDPTPGHYEGDGAFSLVGNGDFGELQMRNFALRMTFDMRLDIAAPSGADSRGDVSVSIGGSGLGVAPVATGRTARSEGRSGTVEGPVGKGSTLRATGADLDLSLRVQRVTCSEISGVTVMTVGSIASIAAARAAAGMSDTLNPGSWRIQLAGRDEALEARAADAVQRADSVDARSTVALELMPVTIAFARELASSADPFAKCLALDVQDSAARLAGRRASASIGALARPFLPATGQGLIRRAWQDAYVASTLGCSLTEAAWATFPAAHLRMAGAEAESGANGHRLMERLRSSAISGGDADIPGFLGDMNAAALAAGRAQPFPGVPPTPHRASGGAGARP